MRFWILLGLGVCSLAVASERGLAPGVNLLNRSLTVGVSKGLPGIGDDVTHVSAMVENTAYGFENTILRDGDAPVRGIADALTQGAEDAGETGTFLFYFTGHGNSGVLLAQDRTMSIKEIRAAVEKGRANAGGPVARLVMIFDSCYAGSLLDPLLHFLPSGPFAAERETQALVDEVTRELSAPSADGTRADAYWKSLFVFAACRANETSLAGDDGSVFTNALMKAFDETMASNAPLSELVKKTQSYTHGHHPVARFDPSDLANEKMHP